MIGRWTTGYDHAEDWVVAVAGLACARTEQDGAPVDSGAVRASAAVAWAADEVERVVDEVERVADGVA